MLRCGRNGAPLVALGWARENERHVRMKTIMILAVSLAMTGAALAQGGNDNGGPSDPRNRAAQMGKTSGTPGVSTNLNGASTQKKHRSQHLGASSTSIQNTHRSQRLEASTWAPGQQTHWYKRQPGVSYWAPGHQRRVYGATSQTREITTTTRGASTLAPGHQKRLYGATSGPREITTETTTRHGNTSRRLPAARGDTNQ
jgi:hypothetical protein